MTEKFTKTPYNLSSAENRSETPHCASLLFPTDIRFNADDFLRVWATASNGMDSCTWPELNAVGNCSSLRLQIVVQSRQVTTITNTNDNTDINMEVCDCCSLARQNFGSQLYQHSYLPYQLTVKLENKTSLCGRDGRTLCGPQCVIVIR